MSDEIQDYAGCWSRQRVYPKRNGENAERNDSPSQFTVNIGIEYRQLIHNERGDGV